MTVSWYKINIIRFNLSPPIFSGYFKVDSTNHITEFYNSDETTSIIDINDREYGPDYIFINNNFTSSGTNINSIPNLNFEFSAIKWCLMNTSNSGAILAYKTADDAWYELYNQFTFSFTSILSMPSRFSEVTTQQIQSITTLELQSMFQSLTSQELQVIIRAVSTEQIQAFTPEQFQTIMEVIMPQRPTIQLQTLARTFTPTQLQSISTSQLYTIVDSVLESLTQSELENALQSSGGTMLQSLNTSQLVSLVPFLTNVSVILAQSPSNYSSILSKIESTVLQAVTPTQIIDMLRNIDTSKLVILSESFSPSQVSAVSAAVLSSLTADIIDLLPSSFVSSVTDIFISTPISNICFVAGTPILTNQGRINIELIDSNVHTIRNKKIEYITKTITQDKYLVCFEKDSINKNIPSQKTIISKNHLIFYKGNMCKAKEFIGEFNGVYKVKYNGEILYNVMLKDHNKMMVNNMVCETLHPESSIGNLYKFLQNYGLDLQEEIIKKYNEHIIKSKLFSRKITK
jgi:Ca2+-binding EF-hand superfamily protein